MMARLLAILFVALMLTGSAFAGTYYWDADATAGNGTAWNGYALNGFSVANFGRTWNTTDALWWNGITTPEIAWNNTTNANDTAVFGGVYATVTISSNINAGGLVFAYPFGRGSDNATAQYTLTGTGTLTLANGSIQTNMIGSSHVLLNSVLAGTNGLTFSGSGSSQLGAANTVTGGIIINGGAVRTSAANQLNGNAITLNNGSMVSGRYGAFGGLYVTTGFTHAGNMTTGANGGVLNVANGQTLTLNGNLSTGAGGFYMTNSGLLKLGANNSAQSFTGGIYVNGGQIRSDVFNSATANPFGNSTTNYTLNAAGSLYAQATATTTNAAPGTLGTLTVGGGNFLTIDASTNAANNLALTFSNITRADKGTLYVYAGAQQLGVREKLFLGTAPTLYNGGTMVAPWMIGNAVAGTTPLWLTYSTTNGLVPVTFSAATTIAAAGTTDILDITTADATLTSAGKTVGALRFSGNITTNGAGNGVLTIGDGTYAGLIVRNTAQIGSATAGSKVAVDFGAAEGVIFRRDTYTGTIANTITGSNGFTMFGNGVLTLGTGVLDLDANTYTGTVTVNGGTLNLNKGPNTVAINGNLVIGAGSNVGSVAGTKGQVTFVTGAGSNQIASTATVTMLDGSDLNLNGMSNTLAGLEFKGSGRVQTGAGTLTLGGNITAQSGNNSQLNNAGYAEINGLLSLGGVTRTMTVNAGPNSPVTFNMADLQIAAVISDGGAPTASGITKEGNGQLALNGANTFTGAVQINNGTVKLGNALALGTAAAGTTVAAGGTLDLGGQSPTAEALTLNGAGVGGQGALVERGNNSSSSTWGGTVNLNTATAIGAYGTRIISLSGIVSGAGNLTKLGNGTLELSNVGNTYSGQVIIKEGTLQIANGGQIGLPSAGNETILLGDTSGTANACLRSAWNTGFTTARGLTVQAGSTGYAMLGGGNTGRNSITINGAVLLNKDLIIDTSSEQSSCPTTFGATSTLSGAGGIIKTELNGSAGYSSGGYGIFTYQGPTTPTHAFTMVYGGLVRWERSVATAAGGDAVTFGNGNITLNSTLWDSTLGKYASADFELYATQTDAAINAPVTLTSNIIVAGPNCGLYGWGDNSGGKPTVNFSGAIDLSGGLAVGSRSSGSSATAIHYTGTMTINQTDIAPRTISGGSQTVLAQLDGAIVDGAGNYNNPLFVYNNAGTLSFTATNNTYNGGTVILPGTGTVSVANGSKLGLGDVTVLPGGKLTVNTTTNIGSGCKINLVGSPAANGVLIVTGNYLPAMADGATGVLSIDTTNFDVVTSNGTMFLSSSLGAASQASPWTANVNAGTGGKFTGTNLSAGTNGYQMGGLQGTLNIVNSVLTGNNNLLVKGINPVFIASQTEINNYGVWSNSNVSQVTLLSTNDFVGNITVLHGVLAGVAQASGSPFGNAANVVTLSNGTLQVDGQASVTTMNLPSITVNGMGTIAAVKDTAASLALTVTSLNRTGNSVIWFTGSRDAWNNGTSFGTTEKIFLTGQADTALLPAYYSFMGKDFAKYDSVNGVTAAAYTLNGTNAILSATAADIVNNTATQDIAAAITVNALKLSGAYSLTNTLATGSITVASGGYISTGGGLTVRPPVTFQGTPVINVMDNSTTFRGTFTSTNGFTKFGAGVLQIGAVVTTTNDSNTTVDYSYNSANRDGNFTTLTGTITVLGGTLQVNAWTGPSGNMLSDDSCLGAWTNQVVLNGGAVTVSNNDGIWFKHNFEIGAAGGVFGNTGGNVWNSFMTGNITGVGQLVIHSRGGRAAGECSWYISGTNNSYTGGTIIANSLQFDGATVAPTSSLGTGDVYVQTNAILLLQGNANVGSANGTTVTRLARVTTDGIVQFKGSAPVIGSLAGGLGSVVLGSDGSANSQGNTLQPYSVATPTLLTVGGDNTSTTFYGAVSEKNGTTGQGSLYKTGTGTLTLAGVSTYTGTTTVAAGSLSVMGKLGSTAVTVGTNGKLIGTGAIGGPVTVAGTIMPGTGVVAPFQNVEGNLRAGNGTGILTVGSLAFSGSANTFAVEVPNTDNVAGWSYGQLVVTGTTGSNLTGGNVVVNIPSPSSTFNPDALSSHPLRIISGGGNQSATPFSSISATIPGPYGYSITPTYGNGFVDLNVLWTALPGDADLNGVIDGGDYDLLIGYFGTPSGAEWTMGDFDYNGIVDGGDYDLLIGYFGSTYPGIGGANVPEPTTMGLLALGVIGLISRRRNRK